MVFLTYAAYYCRDLTNHSEKKQYRKLVFLGAKDDEKSDKKRNYYDDSNVYCIDKFVLGHYKNI